ncbi:phosphotransferase [Streptomyces rubiginosohelvolus]|uniref:phosphotransferase n=1 Tax=Streptomyces rubiginosohelvolus TaxID=67362 RepID=UPI0036DB7B72
MGREPEAEGEAEADREPEADQEPEALSGGLANAGAVLRRGDTVERPAPPHVALLHPLRSVGALLRRMHDAAAGVPFDRAAGWPSDLADPEGATAAGALVCHNDVCLENVVFRDGRAAALIDFDLAAPGRPVWNVAMAARYWAPMRGRPGLDPAHRLRVLADGYGLGRADRAALPRVIEQATAVCRAFVERRVERGDAAYSAAYEQSGRAAWDRHQKWLADHRPALTAALLAG